MSACSVACPAGRDLPPYPGRGARRRASAGELEQLRGAPPAAELPKREPKLVGACPYRGLGAFREVDAPFFFGREDFTRRLLEAVGRQRLVAVIVGSSGCGKSSTVFAGLLPQLRAQEDWVIAQFRPGR